MSRPIPPRRRAGTLRVGLALAAMASVTWACDQAATPTSPAPVGGRSVDLELAGGLGPSTLEVYTQNVYLGGDTGPLFMIDLTDIAAVLQATNRFWAQVQASDVPGRMAAIVDEIAERRPEVVGLQEVARFLILDPATGEVLDAIDLLAALEAAISARGLPYVVERVQENTTGALPLAVGAGGITRALAFTERVVALRRTDVDLTGGDQGRYAASVALGPVAVTRGWIRLTFEKEGVPVHFVTTHLETQALAAVQAGQADELIGSVLAGLDGVTILTGDLNSDASASEGEPSWTPTYDRLRAAGFTDAWARDHHLRRDPGLTCCQEPDLRNEDPTFDQRLDFVLVRAGDRGPDLASFVPGRFDVELIGEEQADRVEGSGVWPSDHAGLAAGMRLLGPGGP